MRCVRSYQDIPEDPRSSWFDEEEDEDYIEEEYTDDEDFGGMDCVDRWKQLRGIEFQGGGV